MKKLSILLITRVSVICGFVTANDLAGTSWELHSFNGTTGVVGTVEFDETMMYSKFCNNVSQGYSLTASGLVASGAGMSTMMYCEGMPMTLEGAFVLSETLSPVVISGQTMTITTSGSDLFVFTRTQILLQDLQSTCIQAYDECSNMCTRNAGTTDRACTKMGCTVKKDAQCIMSTDDEDELPVIVGGDEDEHGCKGSAGYSWSQVQQQCVRVWELTGASTLDLAYDFAFNQGMTTMQTVDAFRAKDFITRQEAAKMLVGFAYGNSFSAFSDTCDNRYSDESMFDPTLKSFIYEACAHGMMKGSKGAFMPNNTLTKGEALTILMRTVDGIQSEEDTATWWMPYVTRARALNLLTIDSTDDFNNPITREELIVWAHTIFKNSISQ